MYEDDRDVANQAEYYADSEPLEEQLLRLREVLKPLILLLDSLGMFRQWLPSRTQGRGLLRGVIIIITGRLNAPDGEGYEVDEEDHQRIGDLEDGEEELDRRSHFGSGAKVHGASKQNPAPSVATVE